MFSFKLQMLKNSRKKIIDLSITNIDDICEDDREDDRKHPCIPRQPFRALITGSSGSGKTNFVYQLLTRFLNIDKLYVMSKHLEQGKMVALENHYRTLEEKVQKKFKKPDFKILEVFTNDLNEIPEVDELDPDLNNVILFDDCMLEKQDKIIDYFIKGRHSNCSVIYLSQQFSRSPRSIRLNCSCYFLFNIPSLTDISFIHRECAPDLEKDELLRIYKNAMSVPYNFLTIDTCYKNPLMKYRVNLDESPF